MTKVVLVTGGVRGLGLASASALAERGARVHVAWRSSKEEASAAGTRFDGRVHQADLETEDGARALVREVVRVSGRLDALVHAVGDYTAGPLDALSSRALLQLVSNNVGSAWNTWCAAREALRAARGRVVFFGCAGLEGLRAKRVAAGYAAAKSALVVLARSLALEESANGLSVNVVSPGLVPHAHAHPDTMDPAAWARLPRGRPTDVAEIGALVAWLVLDAPSDLTGADLPVAGGWMS